MPGPDSGGATTSTSLPVDSLRPQSPQLQQQPHQPLLHHTTAAPSPAGGGGDHSSHKPVSHPPSLHMDGDSDRGKVCAAASGGSGPHSGIPPLAGTSAAAAAGPTTHTILPAAANNVSAVPIGNSHLKAVPTSAIARVTGSIIQEAKTTSAPQILIAPNYVHTAHPIKQEISSASPHLTAAGTLAASAATASAQSPAVATIQHPICVAPSSATTAAATAAASSPARLLSSSALAVATAAAVQPLSVISNNISQSGPSATQPVAGPAAGAATSATSGSAAAAAAVARLKVEDALSYLDQVKLRFNDQPQVYNDFLDIMKEFKSQTIDTPGVIQRVSTLFRGHAELIVGFNTFLPPGYKIEMHANEQVSVSMPSSTIILQTGHGTGPLTTVVTNAASAAAQPLHFAGSAAAYSGLSGGRPVAAARIPSAGFAGTAPVVAATANHNKVVSLSSAADAAVAANSSSSGASQGAAQPIAAVSTHGATNGSAAGPNAQPVEFNHAINYVNKIKNRFQGQPEVYKQFLEILHTYQKEQKSTKENTSLTESAVYQQVAKLFQNQTDLLQEFGQFLPDANGGGGFLSASSFNSNSSAASLTTAHQVDILAAAHRAANNDHGAIVKKPLARPGLLNQNANIQIKRLSSQSNFSINKRIKMTSLRDVTHLDAGKVGSLNEYAFFDKVRKALRSQEVYENFLRCLVMYNHEIVSRVELVHLVNPFLGRFPELLKSFKDFLGHKEGANSNANNNIMEGLPHRVVGGMRDRDRGDRMTTETGMEIDYATCKRYGASYRALPKNYPQPKCSGRTQLCREVLNDTWVSFPSWSEDSTFVTSKKTQYEEYISKCEDERYELDVVIETNLATIRVLEAVDKKLSRLSPDERSKHRLDDHLGGTSATIHQRAIRRIYGDKAAEIIDGLKKNPVVAVPIVLRRLKNKEEEWREAQKSFNKIWREQNERYYLKSLDHQGISFKQNDIKFLRSKNLLSEIETLFEERHEMEETIEQPLVSTGPHITLEYKDKSMIEESCNLIIHHIKRQTSIHKEDKEKIKQLMRHFVPDLFATPRGELSDDECDDMDFDREDPKTIQSVKLAASSCTANGSSGGGDTAVADKSASPSAPADAAAAKRNPSDSEYTVFFCNNNWYLFFRLHCILCERLTKMYERSQIIAAEEAKEKSNRKESTAIALRLKPKNEIEVEEYFPVFVDMIKQVLDGNLDGNTFEDMLREMFGIHAYIGFTMDKVVQNICRQLQHLACDETCSSCTEIFLEEMKSTNSQATGGSIESQGARSQYETAYQKNVEKLLQDENCFKIMFFKSEGKVTIELLDTESPESEAEIGRWSAYVDKYVRDDDTITDELKDRLTQKPVFLPRNIANWRKKCTVGNQEEFNEKSRSNSQQSQNNIVSANNNNNHVKEDEGDEKMDTDSSQGKEGEAVQNSTISAPDKTTSDSNKPTDLSLKDVVVQENEQCRFNVNSYKMLYIVEGESYIYRKNSLKKAKATHKKVSQSMFNRFSEFHSKWLEQADADEVTSCERWLEGLCYQKDASDDEQATSESGQQQEQGGEGTEKVKVKTKPSSNRTKKVTLHRQDSSPFRTFYRYTVEKEAPDSG